MTERREFVQRTKQNKKMTIFFVGLLTHMEHMRMDPKHQFAAQYVLSRAAAEKRERELLAGSSLGKQREKKNRKKKRDRK